MTPEEKVDYLIAIFYSEAVPDAEWKAVLCALICAKEISKLADAFAPIEVQGFWESVIAILEKRN